jgi:predicted nuclease of restriction endonuclease-like RecB superfamily
MLTADLAQSWQRAGRCGPRYIDRRDADYLSDADALIRIFAEHEGRPRRELDQALEEYVGTGTDYKILRGFIKLLMDRCEFETACPVEPSEIRRALFTRARLHHPVVNDEATRLELLREAALELSAPPEVILSGLYADLPENQKLQEFQPLTPEKLLDIYNLAQAQALLYHCVEMRLEVEPGLSREDYRELFSAIKAYRLIHTIEGDSSSGYRVRLDGPVSMFHRSQKYGVQMAVFLPALLMCKGWEMRAEIASGKAGREHAFFELSSSQKRLQSDYLEGLADENPVKERFAARWEKHESAWTLAPSREVIPVGESAFIPDFVLKHADGQTFYLEILGFWTPRYLDNRLKAFAHARFSNFILAAWDELRGSRDPLAKLPPHAIIFKRSLDPVAVELALNEFIAEGEDAR